MHPSPRDKKAETDQMHSFQTEKRLGQNFLSSTAIVEKILEAAHPKSTETILEIGPGSGQLTIPLAERAREVIAVEKDPRLGHILAEAIDDKKISNVRIITGDILRLFPEGLSLPSHYRVVASIPYYLTSRLIRLLLTTTHAAEEIYLVIQKEVAERLVAKPPHMNLLALAVQLYGNPRILFNISRTNFHPQPRVDSAFIAIQEISLRTLEHAGISANDFFSIARAAFSNKRKIILNSLAGHLDKDKTMLAKLLHAAGIDPGRRPETLSIPEWIMLAKTIRDATMNT